MSRTPIDMIGRRFGNLVVVAGMTRRTPTGAVYWQCRCDCGRIHETVGQRLRSGGCRSCGCLKANTPRHGHARRYEQTPTYVSWAAMCWSCRAAAHGKSYAERGIHVCDRWRDFENFLADMGERPAGKGLSRKDTSGNFEPGNCRWASAGERALNRRPRTECVHGHAYTAETAYWSPQGRRQCRPCMERRSLARRSDDRSTMMRPPKMPPKPAKKGLAVVIEIAPKGKKGPSKRG